jgi:uncharacterized membrane protein YozB (DUF420 family)
VNVAAVVWGVLLITNVGWPRERFEEAEWYQRFAAPLFTAGLFVTGVAVYLVLRPNRGPGREG